MQQYAEVKSKHPDAVLLFRVGDFYETFGADAIKVSEVLNIVLTSRNNGGSDVELAGFPYHSVDVYLPKLVRAGYRVAICEQLEKPSKQKKIVKRGVTDVVTPGVTIDDTILNHKQNNYLASIHFGSKGIHGVAFIDISTGEFLVSEETVTGLEKLLHAMHPSEVLISRGRSKDYSKVFGDAYYHYPLEDWIYTYDYGREQITRLFDVDNLKGYGIEDMQLAQVAAGAALHYLESTQNDRIKHISHVARIQNDQYVWLDRFTVRNLELVSSQHETGIPLISILDKTTSPMGARLLRKWVLLPMLNVDKINVRLQMVSYMYEHQDTVEAIDTSLRQIGDLERIVGKVAMEKINPREVLQLRKSLDAIIPIKEVLISTGQDDLRLLGEKIHDCQAARDLIATAIHEEAPAVLSKGNAIRDGYNEELDELRSITTDSKSILVDIQQRESAATGITSLKIGFNNVFGYYLEVSNKYKNSGLVPDAWIRKQSLTNAERYVTEELKELESKILSAQDKIQVLEEQLYAELVVKLGTFIEPIQTNAKAIAHIDCTMSFAKVAYKNGYTKPIVDDSTVLEIKEGRHPVIERQLGLEEQYIPNDILLSNDDTQIMMITGPNMSGKSAVLRQTALITLMAQMGSYVPAQMARVGIVDKVFTRVGASDNISSGESTFMLEMNETASIMNNISDRSLILLDEIGRGTSTYDGISIAWSLAEYLHNNDKAKPKTLFATHYHELNELAGKYERIKNYNVATKEVGKRVIFLRKLVEGGSHHSFGIHVAKMAGMPRAIITRAAELLVELEKKSIDQGKQGAKKALANMPRESNMQLSIFESVDPVGNELREVIQSLDLNSMTPIDCMMRLHELKKLLEGE